jgi:predicted MFS family arabinose efflux permease
MFILIGGLGLIMQTVGIQALNRKFDLITILLFALFIRSVSFILMPIWQNVFYFVGISIVFAIFNSLVQPIINTLISLNAKPEEQGTAMGINSSYLSISNAFGPVIAGMTIDQSNPTTYSYPLYLAGILTLLVLLLAVSTRNRYAANVISN